jgi:hypothetical protein
MKLPISLYHSLDVVYNRGNSVPISRTRVHYSGTPTYSTKHCLVCIYPAHRVLPVKQVPLQQGCRHVEPCFDRDVQVVGPCAPEVDVEGQELRSEAGEGHHDGAEAVQE